MKPKFTPCRIAAVAFALITPALASSLYWDGGTLDIRAYGDGISTGGAGTWDTSLLNWDAGASPHVAWDNTNNDIAIFGGGTAGTIALGSTIIVGGLRFTKAGYMISGSTITLAPGAFIDMTADSTLGSVLTGSSGLTKTGVGRLFLTGNNTYLGTTSVSGGIVDFGAISLAGFGGGSGRNISVAANSGVRRNTLDNAFLNRLVETSGTITVMTGTTSNNLDFSSSTGANLPNAFLGNYASNGAKCEYNGVITPAIDAYRLGSTSSSGQLGILKVQSGSQGLIVGGRLDLVAANTFTGDTTIPTGAKLVIGNNLALQNSALNVGTSGGTFALAAGNAGGKITGESAATSPTFGGLKGSRNLSSAFTASSGGNNETNLAANQITGFTVNVDAGKSCTYSGLIADFAPATTFTKTGDGIQSLTGGLTTTNSYTGATAVKAGTLAISQPYLALEAPVTIDSGATLRLDFSGTVQVTTLVLNGVAKSAGVYNSTNTSPFIAGTGSITVVDLDADDDGFPDTYELAHTTPPSATALNRNDDLEPDGLTNWQEYQLGTNPNIADTDGDGLNDGPEVAGAGLRPPTNPTKFDTDGDGLSDGVETNTGTWVSSNNTGTNPVKSDTDGDGLTDGVETNTGTYVSAANTGTSPLDKDSDHDNVGDWYEVQACYTNPTDANSKPKVPYPLPKPDSSIGSTNKPVKVFIMMGQSNMVGQGNVDPIGTLGTLATISKQDGKFPNLLDVAGTNWLPRNDVTYKGVVAATAAGPLAPGQGGGTGSIGPELGFGQIMGYYHDEPVLLLKTSEGGKNLGYQLLPLGSPSYVSAGFNYAGYGVSPPRWAVGTSPIPDGTTGGEQYDKTVAAAKSVLNNFSTQYPQYAAQGYVIAGFVWFQGYNDIVAGANFQTYVDRYEMNLVNYIKAIRTEFNAPNVPFVIAASGFDGPAAAGNTLTVINAQLAVSDPVKHPGFQGNVKTVDTRGYWRIGAISPDPSQGYHYNRNAETFMLVGDAAGRAMIDLLGTGSSSAYAAWASGPFQGTLSNSTASLDFDGGGLETGIEWVVGGDPTKSSDDAVLTPALNNADSSNAIFTFRRSDVANADPNTTIVVEYGSSLVLNSWATASNGVNGVTIDASAVPAAGFHTVVVSIPKSLAPGGRLFAHLRVVIAP